MVTNTLRERFPLGEMPRVFSGPHTSLKRKEAGVRQSEMEWSEARGPSSPALLY